MSNISKIKISGTSYNLKDENACNVVELTQAQYDELPTTAKTSNSLFVITDATAGDLSNYYTKSETDGLLDTKLDVTAYTPTDLSNYYTKSETSGATEISTALESKADTATTYTKTETDNAITAATSTKQDTLVSGTNIKTINGETLLGEGNITIQGGGGGGKAIEAGTNISITTGDTADTINCTLNVKNGTNGGIIVGDSECESSGLYAISLGHSSNASGPYSFCNGSNSSANAQMSFVFGDGCSSGINNDFAFMFGFDNKSTKRLQFSYGKKLHPKNEYEFSLGTYNNSYSASATFGHSGNTLFSIGNGYDFSSTHNWHNALEVRQNGDIYIANTNDTSITGDKAYSLYPMIKLQDALGGGGGSSYTAGDGIDITNDVISVTGKVDTSAFTAHTADTVIHVTSDEKAAWNGKQDTLVSGTNIKTINGETLLGEGNIEIQGGSDVTVDQSLDSGSTNPVANSAITNAYNETARFKGYASDGYLVSVSARDDGNAISIDAMKIKTLGNSTSQTGVGTWLYTSTINGKKAVSSSSSNIKDFSLVETSAITTSVTSSSTDVQVPSAKAVYDIVGNIETLLSKI